MIMFLELFMGPMAVGLAARFHLPGLAHQPTNPLVPKALEETGEQRDEAPNLIQMQEHLVAF